MVNKLTDWTFFEIFFWNYYCSKSDYPNSHGISCLKKITNGNIKAGIKLSKAVHHLDVKWCTKAPSSDKISNTIDNNRDNGILRTLSTVYDLFHAGFQKLDSLCYITLLCMQVTFLGCQWTYSLEVLWETIVKWHCCE